MAKYNKADVAAAEERLRELLTAPSEILAAADKSGRGIGYEQGSGRQRVYCIVRSTAKSGMSSKIDFYVLASDGDMVWLTPAIAKLCGFSYSDAGLKAEGCGMDMRFAVLDSVARKLWGQSGNVFRIEGL